MKNIRFLTCGNLLKTVSYSKVPANCRIVQGTNIMESLKTISYSMVPEDQKHGNTYL